MEEKQKKVERWSYPFKAKGSATAASSEVTDPQIYYTALAKAESGYYPVASNGLWHGGVHFDQHTAAVLDQSSVRCIADGLVIAYRIDDHYKKLTYTGSGTSKEVTYSTGFVLVKHRLELPPAPAATTPPAATPPAAEPDLTFYSLYMHLMDWENYEKSGAPTPPTFMCPIHYAVSEEGATNDFSGLFVRGGAPGTLEHASKVAIIPKGCKVRVGDESSIKPGWRKLVSILEGKSSPALAPEIEHWVFIGEMSPTADGDVFLIGKKANDVRASLLPGKGLTVREEAKRDSAAMAVLPVDAQVLLEDGTGSYRKIKSIVASTLSSPLSPDCAPNIAGYIHFESLKAIPQPPTLRTVQVLETPVPIQAGALIGHLGKYQAASQSEAHDLLHLEVFSLDDVEAFVNQSRARANQLKPEQKTLLKIPSSTKVITKEDATQANPPLISDPGQPTTYDMILPLAVLNALPADKKITLTSTVNGTTTTEQWWKLDNLPGEDGNPISGWVKESEIMTPRLHPWAWEGFDFVKETGTLDAMYACKLSADGVLDDGEKTNYQAQINTADSGPVRERLYSIIDLNNDEKLTSAEIKYALAKQWHAHSISRLIVQYESEWYADEGEGEGERLTKWEALNCYMVKEDEKDWEQEKERIKSLLWWTESNIEREHSGIAFHFHPLIFLSQFSKAPKKGDLFVRRGQVTFDAEGNDISGNLYFSRRLHWPGGASGVTLGRGYDMKQRTSTSVYADLVAAGVDHDAAQNFSQGAQLSGHEARDFVNNNRDAYGIISRESQRILFEDVTYPRYEAAAKTRYTNGTAGEVGATPWTSLNDRVRDIAVDLTYQQGSIWDRQLPHISQNDPETLAEYIRETPELSQYESGRQRARYLTGN